VPGEIRSYGQRVRFEAGAASRSNAHFAAED
jgi:hypothetical protein